MMRQLQLEVQIRARLEEAQMQGMTPGQRLQMAEQQSMRAMMMGAQREQMMEAQQEQIMMAEQMRMAGGAAGGPMPPAGMPFPRGPLFFPVGLAGPVPDPRCRPRTESPDNTSDSDGPRNTGPERGSPRRAGVRNRRPGVVYGDWEIEEVKDAK